MKDKTVNPESRTKNLERKREIVLIDKFDRERIFTVGDQEKKVFVIFIIGSHNEEARVKINIKGRNSSTDILGVVIGSGKQVLHLHTDQEHLIPGSVSDLLVKSVLFESAKFNYEGLIKIHQGAFKSNAYQKNQNLLLSPSAFAQSRPYLEISADDVRCTHGSTIGQADKEQLFYLQTRGLSLREAQKLLVTGFLNDVIARIPDVNVVEQLEKKIEKVLSKHLKN